MTSWPADWVNRTLAAAGIEPSGGAASIMRAWKNSTPLPPLSNNPIGFPAGTRGAPSYLGTGYAIFPSMEVFYAAFAALAKSGLGRPIVAALSGQASPSGAWRAISELPWPARRTESDWPAAVLDLSAESYRASVGARPPGARATSGVVGGISADTTSPLDLMASVAKSLGNVKTAAEVSRNIVRKG